MTSISSKQHTYLAEKMDKVSRSFSLVAPEVESPLDDYLAVAYLICRVVDNIEDVRQPFTWQQQRYTEFVGLLEHPHTAEEVLATWETYDWAGLNQDEREMMGRAEGSMLWEIFAQLPQQARSAISRWSSTMAKGMAETNDPDASGFFTERNGVRLPTFEADYNRYCFFVAGTVGRMISDLAAMFYGINGATAEVLAVNSETCGRALQKTNIVKDFAKDLQRGFSFLPDEWLREIDYAPLKLEGAPAWWKRKVLLDVVNELDGSVNYVLSIPPTAVGLRKAGLLMMMPAYETILVAVQRQSQLFTPDHAVKISRITMGQCVLRARKISRDNTAIGDYAHEMSSKLNMTLAMSMSSNQQR